MTLYAAIFYLLGLVTVASTVFAITRSNLVHAVVYLVVSFFGTAMLFYLLGAPFVAILEVIIYAGAIMVLFLFIIMMLRPEESQEKGRAAVRRWLPALVLAGVTLGSLILLIIAAPGSATPLSAAAASPLEFGRALYQRHWFAVEVASFLLFVALVGALYLGRREAGIGMDSPKEEP
ncbi:MAG: NADH-quinone oxidoreductase subunit J family protein [Desulfobaccales bacterium]